MCRNVRNLVIFILLLGISGVTFASPQLIEPGVLWYDDANYILSAHGGGILKEGSTYYWFGEYKDCDPNNVIRSFMGHVTHQFVAHTCYSSTDFANWTFENNVLTQEASGDLGPERVVERPKVVYNDLTSTYVMYMHIDNKRYAERKVGVATCSTVDGNYNYLGSFQPLGNDSKDMTIYKDDDGKAYLISGSINIYQLTDDYLDVNNLVVTIDSPGAEAPAMFKLNGTYYLLNSHSTWWQSNDNYYHTAPAIDGPWTYRGDFTPDSDNTWDSQTTFVQAIEGSVTTTHVFMADRWCEGCFCDSVYIWLPLDINDTTLTVDWYDAWTLDEETGEWAPVTPTPTPTPTPTSTPTPTPTPTATPGPDMYVNDIAMTWYEPKSGYYAARATVWIKDEYTDDVDGATVTGEWSGATTSGDEQGQTGQDGKVTLESKAVKGGGTFTFTVTDVSATGYTYNPSMNVMDSNSVAAP